MTGEEAPKITIVSALVIFLTAVMVIGVGLLGAHIALKAMANVAHTLLLYSQWGG